MTDNSSSNSDLLREGDEDTIESSDPPAVPHDEPETPEEVEAVEETAVQEPVPHQLPDLRTLLRWLLVVAALYATGWVLWSAGPALRPFIIGLVLAYLLLPIVNRLARRLPRALAILIVYVAGIGLLGGIFDYIVPLAIEQTQQLIENIPSAERIQEMSNDLLQQYRSGVPMGIREPVEEGMLNALELLQKNIATYLQGVGAFIFNRVLQILNTLTFLIGFLVIPIWLFYVLNDEAKGRAFIDRTLHARIRADFWNVWNIINQVLSDYVRGQLILGLAVGVMVAAGLLILELFGIPMKYVLLLSIVAGVTELIPIIGPILGAIPGVLIGFFISPTTGLLVLGVYILVQQLENNLLVPRIIGESVGIHPAILTVVLIAMGQVFGLIGIILAAPIAAIARDLFIYIYRRLEGLSAVEAYTLVKS